MSDVPTMTVANSMSDRRHDHLATRCEEEVVTLGGLADRIRVASAPAETQPPCLNLVGRLRQLAEQAGLREYAPPSRHLERPAGKCLA